MLLTSDILDEKDKRIRAKNTDMEFPLSDKDKKLKSRKISFKTRHGACCSSSRIK